MATCKCKEYEPGVAQIDSAIGLAINHGIEYTAPPWKYCPWCGGEIWEESKLIEGDR